MISDKEKLLEELLRVLKPNGILLATVKHLNPKNMNFFTMEKLFTLVEQHGELFKFNRA